MQEEARAKGKGRLKGEGTDASVKADDQQVADQACKSHVAFACTPRSG